MCGDYNEDSGSGDYGQFLNLVGNAKAWNQSPVKDTEGRFEEIPNLGLCARTPSAKDDAESACEILRQPDGLFHRY